MQYPKIQSLYKRDGFSIDPVTGQGVYDNLKRRQLIIGDYSLPEFGNIKKWQAFEKIDGTNIRIELYRDKDGNITSFSIKGRTEDSKLPLDLEKYLVDVFTIEKVSELFPNAHQIVIFGEGYGPKIQGAGKHYRKDVSFICFDIYINGWWLKYEDRLEACKTLGIDHVPLIGEMTEDEVVKYVASQPKSLVAEDKTFVMEGVVCTTEPMLALRSGQILKFKLRCQDMLGMERSDKAA